MAERIIKLPDVGEGIAEAELVEWHVKVGDIVREDDLLAAVMTDKATVEIEAPTDGRIVEHGAQAGAMLPIGAVLFVMETAGEEAPADDVAAPVEPAISSGQGSPPPEVAPEPAPPAKPRAAGHPVLAAPAVRRRAADLGIDLAAVPTSADRVRHEDLDRYLLAQRGPRPSGANGAAGGTAIPLTGLRRQIARRMEEAARHIPHFTYVEELDVTELELLRETLNAGRGRGEELHPLPLLVFAMCRALEDVPQLNAHFDDRRDVVTQFGAVHAGIATQTDKGLMVPVLRDADRLDIWQIGRAIADLAARARAGTITRDELAGSTITVTSLGKLGGIAATPIVNRPEVAILAPHRIIERCRWIDGAAEPRKMMNLSISCDHRIIDGQVAAQFVAAIRQLLETPAMLGLT